MPILKIKESGSSWETASKYDLSSPEDLRHLLDWGRLGHYLAAMDPVEALEAMASYLSRGNEDAAVQWTSPDRKAEAQAVADAVRSLTP